MAALKIKVKREDILKALQLASRAISAKPVIPLLGNVMLEVQDGSARISGYDDNLGVSIGFPVTGKGIEFVTSMPAKLATDLVNNIQSDDIEIKYDAAIQQITLKTEKSSNNLKCMDASDYPVIESVVKPINVPTVIFKEAVTRVAFAASTNTQLISPLLGVLVKIDNGKLVLFATDGYHLSYEEIELNVIDAKKELHVIIDAGVLESIARILEGDFFEMSATDNQVRFRSGRNEIVSQKLDGKMPDYNLVKPGKPKTTITTSTLELLRASKQLELFADKNFTILEVKGMLIEITAEMPEQGNSIVTLAANIKGDPIAVGLNIVFFKQFLQICKTEEFTIDLIDARSAMLFRMNGIKSFYHIIMPMGIKT